MNRYLNVLIDKYDYTEYEAQETITSLEEMDEESKGIFIKLMNGEDISGYSYRDFSVRKLCSEYKLTEVAAVLSISILKVDYDGYLKILNLGNK